MSSDTFTTAMFLITAIAAAAVLINAVFPVIYTMTGTFSSSSHEADTRLRTEVKIINSYANASHIAQVWLKNVGSYRIAAHELNQSDVFAGTPGDFTVIPLQTTTPGTNGWVFAILDDTNGYWDPGETLQITIASPKIPVNKGDPVYFQFVTKSGIARSTEFTSSG